MCDELRVTADALAAPEVKETLKKNTEGSIQRGVFGVPTFEVEGELFWGADSIEFLKDFLKNSMAVKSEEIQRLDNLPTGAARRIS